MKFIHQAVSVLIAFGSCVVWCGPPCVCVCVSVCVNPAILGANCECGCWTSLCVRLLVPSCCSTAIVSSGWIRSLSLDPGPVSCSFFHWYRCFLDGRRGGKGVCYVGLFLSSAAGAF
jgi:hypothetical protein